MRQTKFVCIRIAVLILGSTVFAGCASLRNGGAAETLPVVAADRTAIDDALKSSGSMRTLVATGLTVDSRNAFIQSRLLALDARYYDFITNLRVERQSADAGVQLAQIAMGVAGVATSATRTKTNLAAAAATLAGVKAIIDKEYYFDKTVPALVAMMNAKRLAVLKTIKISMNTSVDQYNARDVNADLDVYERVGQLAEAVAAVEVLAKAEEVTTQKALRTIVVADAATIDLKRALNPRLKALDVKDAAGKNRKIIDAIITLLGEKPVPADDHAIAHDAMWEAFSAAPPNKIAAIEKKLNELNAQ